MLRMRQGIMKCMMIAGCALSALFASCGFGLDPAGFAARTSVSVTLSGAAPSVGTTGEGAARAISTSSGFLYLQTGLTADTAKAYGPYPVSAGSALTVTDIPAGSYSGMILFFVPAELVASFGPIIPGELTTEGARASAPQIFASDLSALRTASIALIPNVEIKEGAKNQVGATLVPITDLRPNGDGNISIDGSSGGVMRRFIRLDGVTAAFNQVPQMSVYSQNAGTTGGLLKNMTMTLHNSSASNTMIISAIGLYDSTGKRIYRRDEITALPAEADKPYTVPWSGDDVYYAYVEFTGNELSCHFSQSIVDPATLVTVTFNPNIPGVTEPTITPYSTLSPVYFPSCTQSYPGHVFKGWATTSTASTPAYFIDTEYFFAAGDLTLYAVWDVDTTVYTVTFDLNGGSGVTGSFDPQSGTTGTIINLPSDAPSKPGYVFLGWSLHTDATSADFTSGLPYTINLTNVTLYAVWTDTTAPTLGAAMVSGGNDFIASTSGVTIQASCYEVGSGVNIIFLGGDAVYNANNEPIFYLGQNLLDVTYNASQQYYELLNPAVASEFILRVENITLITGDGEKTVSLKVRDKTGYESAVVSDTVTLDTVIPSSSSLQVYDLDTNAMNRNTYTNSENVILMLTCGDSGSGISTIRLTGLANLPHVSGVPSFSVTYNGSSQTVLSFDATSITLAAPVINTDHTLLIHGVSLPSPDELKEVTVILEDLAGNPSLVQYSSTTLDRLPPEINVNNPNADHISATVTEVNPNASDYTVNYTTAVYSSPQTYSSLPYDGNDATWDYVGTGVVSGITTLSQPGSGSSYSYVKLIAYDMAGNTTTLYVERKVTNMGVYSVTLY